jgi:antitoxin HigA-1
MALRLEKAFGVSMDMLLRMQAGYDAAQMRRRADEIEVRRFVPSEVAPA